MQSESNEVRPEEAPLGKTHLFSRLRRRLPLLVLCAIIAQDAVTADLPPAAAIASAHPLATEAGHETLRQGGNAFDAAVAVTAALAVVEPTGSGLGGGGFWLLHRASDGYEAMVDGRERAPMAARRNMYLDPKGEPVPGISLDGALAAGIPGTPAALVHLARRYGHLPLKQSLTPAIRIAREGFPVSERYRRYAEFRLAALRASPAAKVLLDRNRPPQAGFILRQPELARTLERIAAYGRNGFYTGEFARRIVHGVRAGGGIWSLEDLAQYRVIEREPVRGVYGDVRITTAALPSSGGIVLMQMLNMLEAFPLPELSRIERTHVVIEAMRRAYRDRALYLGDVDYVTVDTKRLLDKFYARDLMHDFSMRRATASTALGGAAHKKTGENTTHFSIIDREGNRVAATLSINYPFGSGYMPPGTGILLNNEMDDFVMKSGVPNVYGLIGADANAIAPGKRPLSSMTPTFLETDENIVVLGTPGGSRIITMVLLATLEFAHGRGDVREWVALPRFHHQYLPDTVVHEPEALTSEERAALERMGHSFALKSDGYGNMQAVLWDKQSDRVRAASDPRGEGWSKVE